MSEIMNDHERGCQGREYTCTCGYDAERETASKLGVQNLILSLDRQTIAKLISSPNSPADPLAVADNLITYIFRLARLPASHGWQLVPRVPTDKMMILGGFSFAGKVPNDQVFPEVLKLWDKMLTEAAMAGKLAAE